MDNVLSDIITTYLNLQKLGICVDVAKFEERIRICILDGIRDIIPEVKSDKNYELSFMVKVSSDSHPMVDVFDVSLTMGEDYLEPIPRSEQQVCGQNISCEPINGLSCSDATGCLTLAGCYGNRKKHHSVTDGDCAKSECHNSRDKSRISLNGSEFLPKRVFAYRVVKTFIEQHPDCTYAQLKCIFNDDIIRPAWVCKGFLARVEDLCDGSLNEKELYRRYNFGKPNLCLKSGDGVEFFVSTQWMRSAIEKLIVVAEKYGMTCRINEDDSNRC